MAVCPYCENRTELYSTETIEQIFEDDYFTEFLIGYCPKCRRNFQWKNGYQVKYDGCIGIEEI